MADALGHRGRDRSRHPGLIAGFARFLYDSRGSMRGVLDSRPGESRLLAYAFLAVGIGHVVINLPVCYAIINSQLGEQLRNIDNAAHDLGAGDIATVTRIIAPVLAPAILAAFFTSFTD